MMSDKARFLTMEELEGSLDWISRSPKQVGRLELIVRRPGIDQRQVLAEGQLDPQAGLAGDDWGSRTGSPNPDMQLTLMNARVIAALASTKERWSLAGDQLFVDLDLAAGNLPPGTRLKIGSAVIEVTAKPHTGCSKFAARFGQAALSFVNAPERKALHLRGVNARVVHPGTIKTGDPVLVLRQAAG
jgi:MOSC domain-containing protein YiiM